MDNAVVLNLEQMILRVPHLEIEKRTMLENKKKELQNLLSTSVGHCESGDIAENERLLNDIKTSINLLENEHSQALNAISRINVNDYGYCEYCGVDIALKRLNYLPFAPHCVDCQDYLERKRV
ncbi:TraR/DksA family transcriptional regulator [Photobacterium angustum]|uniref:Zinc finger DksA/TraR C4-type domain-containing protein n=1 Tax=Photobacterium angustum TaxID=661 RepID=A0ABX5GYE2_PHOAN|nr:TraR/DksA family transcriptional regulator [Photobacterium angustum]PSX03919.1 hypothetical protein C0W27_20705 [Photobacterium angustum]